MCVSFRCSRLFFFFCSSCSFLTPLPFFSSCFYSHIQRERATMCCVSRRGEAAPIYTYMHVTRAELFFLLSPHNFLLFLYLFFCCCAPCVCVCGRSLSLSFIETRVTRSFFFFFVYLKLKKELVTLEIKKRKKRKKVQTPPLCHVILLTIF